MKVIKFSKNGRQNLQLVELKLRKNLSHSPTSKEAREIHEKKQGTLQLLKDSVQTHDNAPTTEIVGQMLVIVHNDTAAVALRMWDRFANQYSWKMVLEKAFFKLVELSYRQHGKRERK